MTVSRGKYNQIVALEPDKENFRKLQSTFGKQRGVFAYNCGAWNQKELRGFTADKEYRQCVRYAVGNETVNNQIECIALDDLLEGSTQLSNPTLIRFNYSVGVPEALRGAAKILRTYQPKLAICIGFDEIGFVYIIDEIRRINPDYKFYIRFQRCIASAINLYAV